MSERPHVARSWGKKGQTPVIQTSFNWGKLSVIAGLTWHTFYWRLYPGSIKAAQCIDFLSHLKRQIKDKLLIIWDGLAVDRSKLVEKFVEQSKDRLVLARLPAYAPELNPTEYIWRYCKCVSLANFCPKNLAQLTPFARRALASTQRRVSLIRSFWRQAELSL